MSSVVIVGAGQAGADTAAALRGRGFSGRIALVGEEEALPYRRPPLSKGYLGGTVDAGDLELLPASSYADQGIDLVLGDRAARIDPEERSVVLDSGTRLSYDRLVLATGARPRRLPVPGADLDGVMTLRGLADAAALREALRGTLREGGHLLVVGGGFVGLELAATARGMGLEATVVEVGPRLMARALSPGMSEHLRAEHLRQGVRVLLRREVAALRGDASGHVRVAELDGGERVQADLVVFGVGVRPGAELAAAAGLEVGDGILVDRWLRTSDPAIHAIGDCARFPSARYSRAVAPGVGAERLRPGPLRRRGDLRGSGAVRGRSVVLDGAVRDQAADRGDHRRARPRGDRGGPLRWPLLGAVLPRGAAAGRRVG
ncbi:FAD-dependent oxidoreductase [Streptomyces radiopugnans]|nr:FAD-dependent oxidoreductase [Streptomyces radiopugnans]